MNTQINTASAATDSGSAYDASVSAKQKRITGLTVNGLTNPIAVDCPIPLFGWRMESDMIGATQSAYQLKVSSQDGAVLWDSGLIQCGDSQNIAYKGLPLQAKSAYNWTVAVTDEAGIVYTSEPARFETSLMDATYAAWGNAKWIGAQGKNFDAATANLFDLSMTLQIPHGGTSASLIFGANDSRLQNKAANTWNVANENYCRLEINLQNVARPIAQLYVVGMPSKSFLLDAEGKPTSVSMWGNKTYVYENQSEENPAEEPEFTFEIPAHAFAKTGIHDPIRVNVKTPRINGLAISVNDVEIIESLEINPLGGTHDYNSFPNLNSIGFAVPAKEEATFSDVLIRYYNVSGTSELDGIHFDADTGATYDIFRALPGVTVDDSNHTISVKGGTDGVLVYADPSFGSAPMLRTVFDTLGRTPASARLYAACQGNYALSVNGNPVSCGLFNPGNEEYSTTMPYQVFDVTKFLHKGSNAIGAQLAQGWWSGQLNFTQTSYNYYGTKQALLLQLEVTFTDGTTDTVVTDPATWQASISGPVEYESHYMGQRYNAITAAAYDGWNTPEYVPGNDWHTPVILPPRMNNFRFAVRYDTEAAVVKELPVLKSLGEVRKSGEATGSFIYDMGENVIGVPKLYIPEGYTHKGDLITIRYAEVLYPDLPEYRLSDLVGSMMVENLRGAHCTDYYTAIDGEQVFMPQFTFHGYRYIEISGLRKELPAECIHTEVLSSIQMTSEYESSNHLANRLFKNVQNSQTSNFLSLPTDCPQRNERLGWTGDAQVFSMAASYNADVYNFYRNWLKSVRACQRADGSLNVYCPTAAPVSVSIPLSGISWDAALIIIPYNMYKQTGNPVIIEDNLDAIDRYLQYLIDHPMSRDYPHLTDKTGILADWLSIDNTSADEINNAVYCYLAGLAAQLAKAVSRTELAERYSTLYKRIKDEWNACYMDFHTGLTSDNTEASYATPLRYGVIADELIPAAVRNYVETVRAAGHRITSGFSGTPNLVPVLTRYGYIEDAYKLFEQTEYASWLYPVVNGATSVWERWNSYTPDGGFNGNNSMNSFNHFSLGAIAEWMMSTQLGITTDGIGYKHFVLQPTPGGTFTYAKGSFVSNYGTISSGWSVSDGRISTYQAHIPANTTATLYLPVSEAQAASVAEQDGVTYISQCERNCIPCARFELQSGTYLFSF